MVHLVSTFDDHADLPLQARCLSILVLLPDASCALDRALTDDPGLSSAVILYSDQLPCRTSITGASWLKNFVVPLVCFRV